MRVITTKTHGYLDYIVGLLLILAPWILGFYQGGAESWVPIILGAVTIIYSLMTDYELGVSPVLSMRTHLAIDLVGGLLLLISPWLFGFADYIWAPHVIVGAIEICAALMTQKVPHTERRHTHHHTVVH